MVTFFHKYIYKYRIIGNVCMDLNIAALHCFYDMLYLVQGTHIIQNGHSKTRNGEKIASEPA